MVKIPRVIYSLWLQGIEAAPALVKWNWERWSQLNPGYQLEILDGQSVADLLASDLVRLHACTPQALSDVVRARLLQRTGGIWVDATVFPSEPLDGWLPASITESGFFAFGRPGPDRPISSWFLAASEGNIMIEKWWEEIEQFWSVPRSLYEGIPAAPTKAVEEWEDRFPYFWFHYLFQKLVDRDEAFAAAWDRCAKKSADAPHLLQLAFARNPDLPVQEIQKIMGHAPLHKLNWRSSYPLKKLMLHIPTEMTLK